jgi:hypothetical protein
MNATPENKRSAFASLGALGGVIAASGCCLPLPPMLLAASAAGSSGFFVRLRPFLLIFAVLSIGFGFYQSWRAKQCQRKTSALTMVLLWFSAVVVLASVLFPQALANLLAG